VVCVKGSTFAIEGNGARPSHRGDGFKETDVMYTLNTVDRHAVYAMTTGYYAQVIEDKAPTVLARDYKDPTTVCYGIGQDTFNHSKTSNFGPNMATEQQPTLIAKRPGSVAIPHGFDPSTARDVGQYVLPNCGNTLVNGTCPGYHNGVVDMAYTVRRLTPTECSRLQGFPDWWCSDLGTEDPSEEEIRFWTEVWETHRRIVNPKVKPKTRNQILKWIKQPHSDAAEYKMWGNGVALPCVYFVLAGIVWCTQNRGL
jgi:DNA (cytosine-5)-methyltransferase 1